MFNFSTPKIITVLFIALISFSCENNPLDIDVSNVEIELKVSRFENELFNNSSELTDEKIDQLQKGYGAFFQDFTRNVINIGLSNDPDFSYQLNSFVQDTDIKKLQNDVVQLYTDFTPYQSELENAFKHYKYYFPKKTIPQIITYISGFNYAITTDENYLGIGLDMFLGADYKAYPQLGIPKYKGNYMKKECLVTGAMTGWIATEFELMEAQADLLTEMIHQGKILYLLDALMPVTDITLKISYTKSQMAWCENNEEQIWFYFIDNNLLFTKDTKEILKYMGEAPFTQGFPEGSPGRVGHWLGWQIVKAYMDKKPNTSIGSLMNETDAQKILNQSKYKP